jgi:glycosyltransferase involved in cell wall biosynthesis
VAAGGPRTVLYLHSSAGRYGADRQLALIAGGLDRSRYRPLVVLPERGELAGDLEAGGAEVLVLPLAVLRRDVLSPGGVAKLAVRGAGIARALGRLARARRVALVHTNTSVTLGGGSAARAAGAPHVWHVRESYAGFERLFPVHRRLLARADALPCVSEAVREQLAGVVRAEVLPDGLALVPAARDPARARAALELPPGGMVVALLGRISGWKGHDVLVRALAEPPLAATEVHAVLAGAPWPGREEHERALRALIAELGLASRVTLAGYRPDPGDVYAAADVVAVPSTRPDPLPNSALEAAAAGRCVVAAAHGGLPEIVREGETGVLVSPGDAGELARALAELAVDPERRARLGAAAAADVRARFAPERLLERVQALYDRLLAERATGRPGTRPA